jgi:predicted esterase
MGATRILLTILLVAGALSPQKSVGQGEFKEIPVAEQGYEGMSYHVFTPKGARPGMLYPLVFALHGNGQKAKGHIRNIAKVSTADLPVFVVAPQYQKESKFNAPVYRSAGKIFDRILQTLLDEEPIDNSRVVLQGFSMGSNYSTAWINALTGRKDANKPFPFRAAWLNGTAVPPKEPAPKIPYLLFVGQKETAVLGRINVVENVRTAYRRMFTDGLETRYIEIPNMGHGVNRECHRIMREHLVAMPDHTGAVPAKLARMFPNVQELCLRGRFDEALAKLDKVLEVGNTNQKSKARALRGKIIKHVKKFASTVGKRKQPTVADYRELARITESLSKHTTLRRTLMPALKKLEKNKVLALELTAWREFTAGQESAKKDWTQSVATIKSIADGPHKDTWYGLRACAHMQALGEGYPSPYSEGVSKKKGRKDRKKGK